MKSSRQKFFLERLGSLVPVAKTCWATGYSCNHLSVKLSNCRIWETCIKNLYHKHVPDPCFTKTWFSLQREIFCAPHHRSIILTAVRIHPQSPILSQNPCYNTWFLIYRFNFPQERPCLQKTVEYIITYAATDPDTHIPAEFMCQS